MRYKIGVAKFVCTWLQTVRGCDRPELFGHYTTIASLLGSDLQQH